MEFIDVEKTVSDRSADELQMIDILMRRNRWSKVERTMGRTTATIVEDAPFADERV